MREKLGDWIMDVSKYVATAILLTSIFDELQSVWGFIAVVITVIVTLITGLTLNKKKNS